MTAVLVLLALLAVAGIIGTVHSVVLDGYSRRAARPEPAPATDSASTHGSGFRIL